MQLIELEEVDSTNDYLKREYQNLPMQTCVTAKYQTKGRGRNGHVWESHANENLIMSFLFKDFHKIEDAWKMTQLATCSVVGLLDRYRIKATIKWPNDIYVDGKKICGILVETILDPDLKGVIVGIGLNVNGNEYQSMKQTTGKTYKISYKIYPLTDKKGNDYEKTIIGGNLRFATSSTPTIKDHTFAIESNRSTGDGWISVEAEYTVPQDYTPTDNDCFQIWGKPVNQIGISYLASDISIQLK